MITTVIFVLVCFIIIPLGKKENKFDFKNVLKRKVLIVCIFLTNRHLNIKPTGY